MRIYYPCQQAAVTNIQVFKIGFLASIPSLATLRSALSPLKPVGILAVLVVGSAFITSDTGMQALGFTYAQDSSDYNWIPLDLLENVATGEQASDVFLVQNVTGPEGDVSTAVSTLFDLMSKHRPRESNH
jgi:hypothetical protein